MNFLKSKRALLTRNQDYAGSMRFGDETNRSEARVHPSSSHAVLPPEPVQLQCSCGFSGEMDASLMRCPRCRVLYALIEPSEADA